ncbi:MAG: hypothetical protein ACJARW_001250 [Methylophilaceae bacterium]
MRWSDVEFIKKDNKNGEKELHLVKIRVRAETSKVRSSRILMCRGGEYFERLKTIAKPQSVNALVFSVDGQNILTNRSILYHFHKVVELAKIKDSAAPSFQQYC